jgi:hypothetical protein
MTTRYRCSADLHSCPSGTGHPHSQSCTFCRSPLVVLRGTWGTFEWTGTGRYPGAEARRTFTSEKVADRWATARELVVRWIPETPR